MSCVTGCIENTFGQRVEALFFKQSVALCLKVYRCAKVRRFYHTWQALYVIRTSKKALHGILKL